MVTTGKCEVCKAQEARYRCPRCEVKTCSLKCSNAHKASNDCDGKYDVTEYIPKEKMNVFTFKREYNFLMDITSRLHHAQSNPNIRGKGTWSFRFRLLYRLARDKRNIHIYFPGSHSSNLQENTSRYDKNKDEFSWHVNFLLGNRIKLVAKRVPESTIVGELLPRHFPQCLLDEKLRPEIKKYQNTLSSLTFLLEVPFQKGRRRFWKIDPKQSLQDILENSILYSFPEIIVCLPEELGEFIIQPKPTNAECEEIAGEADENFKVIVEKHSSSAHSNRGRGRNKRGRGRNKRGRGRGRRKGRGRGRGVGKKPKLHPLAR